MPLNYELLIWSFLDPNYCLKNRVDTFEVFQLPPLPVIPSPPESLKKEKTADFIHVGSFTPSYHNVQLTL